MKLEAVNLSRRFTRIKGDANYFTAVSPTDFSLKEGAVTVLMGRSGSGKTTLLNMLGGLLEPSTGSVSVDGRDLYAMDDDERSRFRNRCIGVMPQGHSALSSLTVLENVMLPHALYGAGEDAEEYARELLSRFAIADISDVRSSELSGGEARRMTIARALICRPGIILADEPTGDLDDENTALVLETLRSLADEGASVLIVTHENDAARFADEIYRMDGGTLKKR